MGLCDIYGNEIQTGGTGGSSQSELQRKFSGKNIVWLGDSIHAYSQWDGVTVPYLFQYDSKANCYNWCQGGMTMALMDNPSYDAYSGVGMIDAIVTKNFTAQETYANDDHGTAQGNFLQQVAEMKSLDFSKVHTIVIEFGTNDTMKMVSLDNDKNELDTHTTGGALRYMIKTLLTAYPNLNIVVCNVQKMTGWADSEHTKWYDSTEQSNLINEICKELSVPVIDIYNDLGLNDYTKSNLLHDGLHRTHNGKLKQVQLIENRLVQLF